MVSAVVAAAESGKLANLVIGAAMVASNAVLFHFILDRMMERRLGDAYEQGKGALVKSLLQDLLAAKNDGRN